MKGKVEYVAEVEYSEDITELVPVTPPATGTRGRVIGKKRMRCKVVITLDLVEVAKQMGPRAARSKGGKCQDGLLVVKRSGEPVELSREMKPLT